MKKKKKNKKFSTLPDLEATPFKADTLVEGDCSAFSELRVFTAKNDSVVYSYREHFLYFPWENKCSKFYSKNCPPAAYHIERRPDLKGFDFFSFRLNKSKVNLYRYSLENKLCDDLLEFISDNIEDVARSKFSQHLTELRESKIIKKEILIDVDPLFPAKRSFTGSNFIQLNFHKSKKSLKTQNDEFNSFIQWYNNLNDALVDEVRHTPDFLSVETVETPSNVLNFLGSNDVFLNFHNELEVRNFITNLLSRYFRNSGTKFKLALAGSPAFGKTYLKNLFSGYNITDLDDISMFDPILGPQFHKLVNARKWNEQHKLYEQVINTKFKDGLLLIQNQGQVPTNLPTISVITPGHLNRKKLWSDRSLFDTVVKSNFKIFVSNRAERNRLIQILFDEIYNSDNYQ